MALLLSLFLSLAFFLIGLFTLSDYGINWDAPIRMLRGQAYAHIFLTGGQTYGYPDRTSPILIKPNEHATRLNFVAGEYGNYVQLPDRPLPKLEFRSAQEISGKKFSFYQHEAWNGSQFKNDDRAHLPLIDILSAFSNRFFFGVLGVLGDIESYQLVNLFISSIGVLLVCLITFEITGSLFAATIAGLSLALFPLFFAEAHFNSKDPVQAVFFTGSIWAFLTWVKLGKLRWFGVFVGFAALALGVKWNIIFLPFILIPWLFFIRKTEEFKAWFKFGRLGILGVLGGLGIFLFLVAIWPYAWSDPIGRIFSIFSYYNEVGFAGDNLQSDKFLLPLGFNAYPTLLLLTQTPEIILTFGLIGVIGVIRERGGKLKIGYLLLLWLLIPLIRQSLPNMWFFNGLRQIMEVIPALAILAGVGVNYLLNRTKGRLRKIILGYITISFIILIIILIRLHPNQNAYFNIFAGGFTSAVDKNLVDWWFNYGNVYKQAALWLNSNAEDNANLALIDGSMFALSPLWLREDISISPNHFSGLQRQGEYILIPFNPFNPPIFAYRYPARFLNPVHVISIDKVPVLTIFKNDWQFTKEGFTKEGSFTDFKISKGQSEGGSYIEVDLGQDLQVTRLIVEDTPARCKLLNFQVIDEFVKFIPSDKINQDEQSIESFGLLEKRVLGQDIIEYQFAVERARLIRIYPRGFSCFIQGKIREVSYLKQ